MLAFVATLLLLPQAPAEAELEVVAPGGKPVAGARVTIAPLEFVRVTPEGRKSTYTIALQQFADGVRLPRTITDASGRARILLSPQQRVLDRITQREHELVVSAAGFATWRRAIGSRLLPDVARVELTPLRAEAGLVLECTGAGGPLRGAVLIERPFRTRNGRSLWLGDLVPIGDDGQVVYTEPPRVPGERIASAASLREEGYRVTLHALARPKRSWTLIPGRHRLDAGEPDGSWRRIVAERGAAPPGPIEASWSIEGRPFALPLADARVALLGGIPPARITTGAGPVALDGWDPELPLFVVREPDAGPPAPPAGEGVAVELRIVDRRDQPVGGAVVWIEDSAARRAAPGATLFGTSDRDGVLRLAGLPAGIFRVLGFEPDAGEREVPVAIGGEAAPPIRLLARARSEADAPELPGTLLLDLSGAPAGDGPGGLAELEIGVVLPDRSVVQRRFRERPGLVRIEGLVPGPTTFFLRVPGAPATILSGVLNGGPDDPPLRPFETPPRRFRLLVLDPDGAPAKNVTLSLNDGGDAKRVPPSSRLFPLAAGAEPGVFECELALHGTLWIRVHGPDETFADLTLPLPEQEGGLAVRLKRP
jgi:hypothetical protein